MRARGALVGLLLLGFVAGACSSGGAPTVTESVESTSQAITAACTTQTIGFPCDPDGPAGPMLECEGACAISTNGTVACMTLKDAGIASLDGVVCGNSGGVGNAACALHCLGKTCLVSNAPAGAACRPTDANTPCDGQCDGAGTCAPVAAPCTFGRSAQLCQFNTCNFTKATTCKKQTLLADTLCSDNSACRIGACDATGVCVPGNQIGCDDGNPCTDDTCDPKTGGCIGTPNDNNPCDDHTVCTTGDHCSNGVCTGTPIPPCDDGDPCTDDVCDWVVGCLFVPHCIDGNACTKDTCDPATRACTHSPISCDDENPCTTDSCSIYTGCAHAPIQTDACLAGGSGGTGGGDAGVGADAGEAGASVGGTGVGGSGAESGTGGSSVTGSGTMTASGGSGVAGSGGSDSLGASGASDTTVPAKSSSKDSGGCGCRIGGNDSRLPTSAALAIAALAFAALRRRRQR
ncbi:MAG TPA: MYXO-CTERM sorting domain-containing protein [Polyangiaceae bacterium]|jgi:MYXO-CTERM domain-containing protein|nr:MYXO-CTERM sorting domain-containing protein [Polyangiaceae bacterium]